MLHVNWVEAHDGRVQPDVRLRDLCPEVIRRSVLAQMFLCAIEGREERRDGLFVGVLRGSKTGFVDPVVDIVVGPFVRGFDFIPQLLGKQID